MAIRTWKLQWENWSNLGGLAPLAGLRQSLPQRLPSHMTSEVRVNVLDMTEEGDEWHGYGSELEAGRNFLARPKDDQGSENFDLMTAHDATPAEYDFAEIIDLSGDKCNGKMDGWLWN